MAVAATAPPTLITAVTSSTTSCQSRRVVATTTSHRTMRAVAVNTSCPSWRAVPVTTTAPPSRTVSVAATTSPKSSRAGAATTVCQSRSTETSQKHRRFHQFTPRFWPAMEVEGPLYLLETSATSTTLTKWGRPVEAAVLVPPSPSARPDI
jgi:hypothetical protein